MEQFLYILDVFCGGESQLDLEPAAGVKDRRILICIRTGHCRRVTEGTRQRRIVWTVRAAISWQDLEAKDLIFTLTTLD